MGRNHLVCLSPLRLEPETLWFLTASLTTRPHSLLGGYFPSDEVYKCVYTNVINGDSVII